MAEAVLFNLATDILELAGSITFSRIQLVRGARDELDSLKDTVETIRAVLLDAEKQQWHNHPVKPWLRRLKDALYDVQDLLDDVATEDLRQNVTPNNKVLKAIRSFFSKSNAIAHRAKMANEIQELKKKLDRIANDKKFHLERHLSEETMTIGKRKKTEIFAPDGAIIGREEDKKKIKQLLFDSSSSQSVSFVSIIGKGGLGKTALARLVYNDGEVREHFRLNMWVCVSDVFDVNLIIKEILKSAKDDCQGHDDDDDDDDDEIKKLLQDLENKPVDQLLSLLHRIINKKKYLLVLDDLWNEDRDKWLKLGDWLEVGLQGSKILVTTRSHKVAKVTDAKSVIHVLHGLSEDKSWNLFKKMAFGDGTESLDLELEKTGRDIVKKCAGVPLAIRTIGCLLYGKEKDLWLHYKGCELPEIPEIDEDDGGILQVLKFSYDHLPSRLKHCFAYCSLFPKDHLYDKDMIIHLWVAQGFIESRNREDNLEEVANNYLSELLCRSFLDAASKGNDGKVLTFKMHDLMHDLAQKVAGGECKIVNYKGGDNDRGIRHASFISEIFSEEKMVSLLKTSKLRTFLFLGGKFSILNSLEVFSRCRHCRALGLGNTNISLLPSSFGKLKQLKFLDICMNDYIQSLPNSITDLVNLQILRLIKCTNLQTFPRDLMKLVNLKYLFINGCDSLSRLPPLSELPSLRTLSLKSLRALELLQRTSGLEQSSATCPLFPSLESLVLVQCRKLKECWGSRQVTSAHQKFRSDNSQSSFPKLRSMEISGCPELNFMPPFPQVESLKIDSTEMLEQQLMANLNCPSEPAVGSTFIHFSKLKRLHLYGWFLEPQRIETLLQLASNLESMRLECCNLRTLSCGMQNLSSLRELNIDSCEGLDNDSCEGLNIGSCEGLHIDSCEGLDIGSFEGLHIDSCEGPDIGCKEDKYNTQWQFLKELCVLKISYPKHLRALPKWIQHATTLQSLEISYCQNLCCLPKYIGNFSLLEKLVLSNCPKLTHLPSEMRNLIRLKELRILRCPNLKERCLTQGHEDWLKIAHIPVIVWEDESERLAW